MPSSIRGPVTALPIVMRNYCKFRYCISNMHTKHSGDAVVQMIGRTDEDIGEQVAAYISTFSPFNDPFVWRNPDDISDIWMELSRDNVFFIFRLLAWAATDECVTTWVDETGQFGGLKVWDTFELFVTDSPRDTWSNGH